MYFFSPEFRSTKYPDLNPILASDSTPLRYDVRQSPRNDIAPETYMSNRFSTATASSATHLRLVSKSFPWSIDIVSNSPITCEDVLDALYHALQQHIADSEWGVVIGDKKLRETIEQSAKTRTKSDRDKRLKRVDWLGGSTIFRGLDKIEEFQEMRLLPGTEPCIETWVVNMESL
ncbi:hypothetical protein B0H19DRAFT_944162 [Mycena capillaripes]|nr:hypothetical protein B0H19DRAFT_944162 [Mycena capillaripes]